MKEHYPLHAHLNMAITLVCFHGSPGTPADFSLLERQLQGKFSKPVKMVREFRSGYEGGVVSTVKDSIVIGYSWGSVEALRRAAESDDVRGVVLISPYLFPENRLSFFKKILLHTPILWKLLLKLMSNGIIDSFLNKSSSPEPVPEEYRKSAEALKDINILRRSALEKEQGGFSPILALQRISGRSIPVALIWGDLDQTSSERQQLEPIRSVVPLRLENKIKGAGHALVWTHPGQVAQFILKFMKTLKSN